MDQPPLPDFRGKVVCLFSGFDLYAKVVHDPRWEEQAGRLFLCGAIPAEAPRVGDYHGGELCFAWDDVEHYIVFDSLAAYLAKLQRGPSVLTRSRRR